MALQLQDMLMRLQPLAPLNPAGGGSDKSLERKKLELARQQFEETKRQHLEETRLREMAEAGEVARARMQNERALQAQQAAAQAKVMDERRAAYGDIYKYEDAGDVEGIENAANRLNEAGGSAERLGEDANGMPSWRVETNPEQGGAEQAAQSVQAAPQALPPGASDESLPRSLNRMNALGYGKLGTRGNLNETRPEAAEPLSTEDAFGRAQAASEHAETAGAPMRGPDAPDFMGGVPKNVIDTGAMAEQTKQRLGPVMANIEASMPAAHRDATKHADDAALGAGFSGPDALKQSLALRAPADAAIKDEQDAEREAEKARLAAAPKELTRKDIQRLAEGGEKEAEKTFKNSNLDEVPRRAGAAQNMIDILQDDDPNNDQAIAFELPNMLGSKGAQSNKDLAVALGIDAMSTTDQIVEKVNRIINGGFTEMRRDSLVNIIKKKMEADDELVFKYLDAIDESSKRAVDPDVRRGLEDYANRNVPKEYREAWTKMRAEHPEAAGAAADDEAADDEGDEEPEGGGDFKETLSSAAADHGLDPAPMLRVMGGESNGGDPKAASPNSSARGIIQMLDSTARDYVNPRTGEHFKNAAEYGALSAAEQAPIAVEHWANKFKKAGVAKPTPEDYALAVAAPAFVGKSANDTAVVYPKDSEEWKVNKPWRPADGGDITVGSIIDYYFGNKKKKAEPAKSIALLDADDKKPAPAKAAAPKAGGGKDDAKLLEGL